MLFLNMGLSPECPHCVVHTKRPGATGLVSISTLPYFTEGVTDPMAFPMVYAGVLAAGVAYAAMPPSAQPYRKYVEQDASLNARYPKGKRLYSTLPNEPVEFEAAECGPASETYPHMVESLRQACVVPMPPIP